MTRGGRPMLDRRVGQEQAARRSDPSQSLNEAYWIWDTCWAEIELLKYWWDIFPRSYWNWKEMEGSGSGWKRNRCLWWNKWLERSERPKARRTGAQMASHTLESPASLGEAEKVYRVPLPSFQ